MDCVTYRLLRSVGFRLDAERAHHWGLRLARATRPFRRRPVDDPIDLWGLRFPNRVGLAAGYDKDGTTWRALAAMGFGHIEVGTVTPLPQRGNPRPRITRIPADRALLNAMGFPSAGASRVLQRIAGVPRNIVLGVSIGPNASTPPDQRINDYLSLVDTFAPHADYLAINVSSPNTVGLRDIEQTGLRPLLEAIAKHLEHCGAIVPIVVKLSPDIADLPPVIATITEAGVAGIVLGNTTTSHAYQRGGLSGGPLTDLALAQLRKVRDLTDIPIIACGGIMSAQDARDRIDAGASLVQVYTGLVYSGPALVRRIATAIAG